MKRLTALILVLSSVLAGQQIAYAEPSDSEASQWWGGVNLKYWMASYQPSKASYATTTHGQALPTIVVGYDRFFYTLTLTPNTTVTDNTYPAGGITLQEQSFGFGYNINSNFAVVLGYKTFTEMTSVPVGNNPSGMSDGKYTTAAAVINWPIPDSKAGLFGNIGIGQASSPTANSSGYTGYELGVNYAIFPSSKVSLGYKSESLAMPYNGTATQSGLFGGISYSF